jgi:pSer/pThr/pTyr-binding forkhead associated (FHA) protein
MSSPSEVPVAAVVGDAAAIGGADVPPTKLPPGSSVKLISVRGLKLNVEYPVYEGGNYIGRSEEKPVDIDLDDQEPQERSWISRQHCLVTFANDELVIEDLNSANGTYVNRQRVAPGQKRGLAPGDVIQLGTIHLKVTV